MSTNEVDFPADSLTTRAAARDPAAARRSWRLIAWMLLSVVAITSLALLDQKWDADAALRDHAREQRLLAQTMLRSLRLRLSAQGPRLDLQRLISAVAPRDHRPGSTDTLILLRAPGEAAFTAADGRAVHSAALETALRRGPDWLELSRQEAEAVGLVKRRASAGIAKWGAGPDTWAVIVVASAARERDRALHTQWRFILSVGLAATVILAFGTAALRTQRSQLRLERALHAAALREERNAQLARETRAVTMLTLAAGVAHEVSTPLNVIAGRAEQVVYGGEATDRVRRMAKTILEQSQRVREVIHGFLDLARGEAPVLAAIAPEIIVQNAVELVHGRCEGAGVSLSSTTEPGLPNVSGNTRLLEQALVNLLLNACDACEAGGRVEVQTHADGAHVCFSVVDDGVGIRAEHAARVLEPFFSTKPHAQGSGLGLAVTKEIVAMHRGTLEVAARFERGTRAAFWVPVAAQASHG